MKIQRAGSEPSSQGPAEWFAGRVRIDPLFPVEPPSAMAGNLVTFEPGSLLEASEVANVVLFMLTRPRGMTIRDVVMMPTNFDL